MAAHQGLQYLTPFIGRQNELVELARLLDDPACRLLTLVGLGGIGKTRLALEAARTTHFNDGIYIILLQPLSSPELIVSAVVDILPFSLLGSHTPRIQLLDYLHRKELLLVLDNFEHLMDGIELLTDILENAPGVKLLVTSRERLRLREEWVFDVTGLALPKDAHADSLESYSAAQLFIENARRIGYKLQVEDAIRVIRICRLVEGSPLAIELAASWVRTLSCDSIAQEIVNSLDILATTVRNFPEKHRSMRSVFTHSLSLCTADERALFRRLAVFPGDFGREAAEQVAGASLALLASLVDRSLLRVTQDGRYSLHELLRQFSAEQLAESAEEGSQLHERHCAYYARLTQAQWPRLTGSEIKAALTTIRVELNNVRSAWDWAVSHRKAAEIEAVLPSLWFFYGVSSQQQEGIKIFGNAASAFQDNTAVYGKLLARWGELEIAAGAFSKANALLHDSLSLLRQVGARSEIGFVLFRLVLYRVILGLNAAERTEIPHYLEESLALFTELDAHFNISEVLLGWGYYHLEDNIEHRHLDGLERAQQYLQKSLIACQQCESLFGIANTRVGLSEVAAYYGDYPAALQHIQVSRKIYRDLGIDWGIIQALALEGLIAYKLDNYELARWCVLENLSFNLERGLDRTAYGTDFIAKIILSSLHQAAALLMVDGKQTRAYEVQANVNQQFLDYQTEPDRPRFFFLNLLDDPRLMPLIEAVNRGPARDLESVIKDVIVDLSALAIEASSVQPLDNPLNEREIEIIQLVAAGLNTREAAEQLFLSVNTVRWYLREIYSKLDVHSRAELMARSRALQLLN